MKSLHELNMQLRKSLIFCFALTLIFIQASVLCLEASAFTGTALSKELSKAIGVDSKLVEERLAQFEKRMRRRGDSAEIAACYAELNRLCKNEGTCDDAKLLGRHLLIELADPTQVNQGNHNTCALAALQTRLYDRIPSVVCRTVREALSGNISVANGKSVRLAESNIAPDSDASSFRPDTPYRSYASQLFQLAAANVFWQSRSKDELGHNIPQGAVRYVQDYCRFPQFDRDTRERLLICWSDNVVEYVMDESGKAECSPRFCMEYIDQTYKLLTGDDRHLSLLAHKNKSVYKSVLGFKTEAALLNQLKKLKNKSSFPALISVRMSSRTFSPIQKLKFANAHTILRAQEELNKGWHVVCITDYDEKSQLVSIDNFWGPYSDHFNQDGISLHALYLSSCPEPTVLPKRED